MPAGGNHGRFKFSPAIPWDGVGIENRDGHGYQCRGSGELAAGIARVQISKSEADKLWRADAYSDWDFQVIASRSKQFENGAWTKDISGFELQAYAARTAIIGGVPKVSAVFTKAEADLVIIPAISARLLRWSIRLGLHKREGRVRRHVQDLAEVIRPGWRFLKGGEKWGKMYRRAIDDVQDPHLEDQEVRNLAESFVCDYVWTLRKIARGELMAAQRMLFLGLAE